MYEILGRSASHRNVELWSSVRLPFEPKGEMLVMRTELREAVGVLPGMVDGLLDAMYESVMNDVCDVENVLIYNVGPSAFAACRAAAVRVRRFRRVPPLSPSGTAYPHYCSYTVVAGANGAAHQLPLATFETAPLPGSSPFFGPWRVWRALKRGQVHSVAPLEANCRLGISVVIETSKIELLPFGVMKCVLDGLISGMHCHDGSDLARLGPRVATRAGISEQEASQLLMESPAILGCRRLVWAFREGVQMNPADDLFDDATVGVRYSTDGLTRIHGTVFAID